MIPASAAYVDQGRLVLVSRDPQTGRLTRREIAPRYSAFIKGPSASVARETDRFALRVETAGDYLRSDWKAPWKDDRGGVHDPRRAAVKWMQEKGLEPLEADVGPIRRHYADTGEEIACDLSQACYLDIETDDRVPIAQAIDGKCRVLAVSVVPAVGRGEDGQGFILGQDSDEAERDLIRQAMTAAAAFDIILAWNGDRFDFPILPKRAAHCKLAVDWRRWNLLDHMEVYRKYSVQATGEQKVSASLNAVAQAVCGKGKVDVPVKMYDAWKEQPRLVAERNLSDAYLMRDIETKTRFVAMHLMVCRLCRVFPGTWSLHATEIADGYLLRQAVQRGYHFPSRPDRGGGEPFEGAYVMDPTPGVYEDVQVVDFSSLYPSVIQSWNMSLDTYLPDGVAWDGPSAAVAKSPATGARFRADFVGIVPAALDDLVARRKVLQAEQAKVPAGTDEWVSLDGESAALKVVVNSFYGVLGSPWSRYYVREIGRAVSLTARWLTEKLIEFVRAAGVEVIYADTDSAYLLCGEARAAELVREWNEVRVPALLAGCKCPRNTVKLAYEKTLRRFVLVKAKRYAGALLKYKGTLADPDAIDVRGLEYRRGDQVRLCRQMQEEAIRLLLRPGSLPEVGECEALVARWCDWVMTGDLGIDDVAVSKSIQSEEYAAKTPPEHARVAAILKARGEDVAVGSKIKFWIARNPEQKTLDPRPAADFDLALIDREYYWNKRVWPATERLLEVAFPKVDWSKFKVSAPKRRRAGRAQTQGGLDFAGEKPLVIEVRDDGTRDEDGWRRFWEAVRAIMEANPGPRPVEVHILVEGGRAVTSPPQTVGAGAARAIERLLGRGSVRA